jgi:hypothetical protein
LELTRTAPDIPSFQFPPPDTATVKRAQAVSAKPEFEPFVAYLRERSPREQIRGLNVLGLSLIVILALGSGAWFYVTRQNQLSMPMVRNYLRDLTRLGNFQDWNRSNVQSGAARLPRPQAPAPGPGDEKIDQIPQIEPINKDLASVPDSAPDTEIQVPPEARDKAADRPSKIAEKKRAAEPRPAGVRIANDQEIAGRKLEMEIYKAISDRAISGVEIVSVSDGTVYLDGRVATPRQKLAAVRAALSVPGVKSVRDRIVIDN